MKKKGNDKKSEMKEKTKKTTKTQIKGCHYKHKRTKKRKCFEALKINYESRRETAIHKHLLDKNTMKQINEEEEIIRKFTRCNNFKRQMRISNYQRGGMRSHENRRFRERDNNDPK
uniref:Uncharacterized protein n=1 Tax=Strongyloides venezuelensis TaxID=75913 RepID=A0A0K0FQ35_STRVS